jgi:hypothetical protein
MAIGETTASPEPSNPRPTMFEARCAAALPVTAGREPRLRRPKYRPRCRYCERPIEPSRPAEAGFHTECAWFFAGRREPSEQSTHG